MKFGPALIGFIIGSGESALLSSPSKNDIDISTSSLSSSSSSSSASSAPDLRDVRESILNDDDYSTKKKKAIPIAEMTKQLDPHQLKAMQRRKNLQIRFAPTTNLKNQQVELHSLVEKGDGIDNNKRTTGKDQHHEPVNDDVTDDATNSATDTSTDGNDDNKDGSSSNDVEKSDNTTGTAKSTATTTTTADTAKVKLDYGHLRHRRPKNIDCATADGNCNGAIEHMNHETTTDAITQQQDAAYADGLVLPLLTSYGATGTHEANDAHQYAAGIGNGAGLSTATLINDVDNVYTRSHQDMEQDMERQLVPTDCAAMCSRGRPKIQMNGSAFRTLIESCAGTYNDTGNSCPGYLDYSNVPISCWDTSSVTDMTYAFSRPLYPSGFNNVRYFNKPIDCWDVSRVTTMSSMFQSTYGFNQSLNQWDVSSVKSMVNMFAGAFSFNQPLNNWNVESATNMSSMFSRGGFNQQINDWDVGRVTNTNFMFFRAYFDKPLNNWNVSRVNDMKHMFREAYNFNQPLNDWNVSRVTNMEIMFFQAKKFNQPLDDWNVSRVKDMLSMFFLASDFNQCLSSWAEKTPSNVETYNMLRETSCPNGVDAPNGRVGPWCQGVKDGCIVGRSSPTRSPTASPIASPTASPTAPPKACMNSNEFNCTKFLKNRKKRGKKCSRIKKGERVRNLCAETCKRFLCTCVDDVTEFTIKGKKGKKFTCAELNTKYCKKKNGSGFIVQSICPNRCNNNKNCLNN